MAGRHRIGGSIGFEFEVVSFRADRQRFVVVVSGGSQGRGSLLNGVRQFVCQQVTACLRGRLVISSAKVDVAANRECTRIQRIGSDRCTGVRMDADITEVGGKAMFHECSIDGIQRSARAARRGQVAFGCALTGLRRQTLNESPAGCSLYAFEGCRWFGLVSATAAEESRQAGRRAGYLLQLHGVGWDVNRRQCLALLRFGGLCGDGRRTHRHRPSGDPRQFRRNLPAELSVLVAERLDHVAELDSAALRPRQHRGRKHRIANVPPENIRRCG